MAIRTITAGRGCRRSQWNATLRFSSGPAHVEGLGGRVLGDRGCVSLSATLRSVFPSALEVTSIPALSGSASGTLDNKLHFFEG